ncbi:MAG: zinc dependent phospholipase C family protein [Bacilli bacterium]|nr:zinc dependent phospholipase C family protein [Bacilli bacterium]
MKKYGRMKELERKYFMASSLTHAYFILDVYDRLGMKSRELLMPEKELLKTAAQSMDVLFFYNLTNLKKGKKMRDFGEFFHQHRAYEFFETLIQYIKYNQFQYDSEVMAFLYGMLSHYILDSTIHPYVVYRTGYYDKKNPETYKYNQFHGEMESYFDDYLVMIHENKKPWKFPCHKFCFNVKKIGSGLQEVMDFTYKEVWGIEQFHKYYLTSIQQMRFFYRVFRYDPYGFKRKFYQTIDFICPKSFLRKAPLSYHMKMQKNKWFLNLEHKRWYNPTDKRTQSTESLLELYTSSLNTTVQLIRELNQYLYYDKKIQLKKLIQNRNYLTGKDCAQKKELKHFEF